MTVNILTLFWTGFEELSCGEDTPLHVVIVDVIRCLVEKYKEKELQENDINDDSTIISFQNYKIVFQVEGYLVTYINTI